MQAIDILMSEHQTILKKLTSLEEDCNPMEDRSVIVARDFTDFVKNFVDKFHHDKEEKVLFPWLLEKNPMFKHGPVHVMLMEHDQGRQMIKEMDHILGRRPISQEDRHQLKELMNSFKILLQNHIHKEDNVLYQMAENINAQTQDGDRVMLPQFEEIENSFV